MSPRRTPHEMLVVGPGIPLRGDVGGPEATRDPIFLIQKRQIRWSSCPDGFTFDKESGWPYQDSCGLKLPTDMAERYEKSVIWWDTESVWFTREEAQAWVDSHLYRWPDGMRVFCICAEGELARLLRAFSLKPTGTREA